MMTMRYGLSSEAKEASEKAISLLPKASGLSPKAFFKLPKAFSERQKGFEKRPETSKIETEGPRLRLARDGRWPEVKFF